jgi:predicted transcriptional regulator
MKVRELDTKLLAVCFRLGYITYMRLEKYLQDYSISAADFAGQIGAKSRATVYRYIKGIRMPEVEVMTKIFEVTNGQVTANDFYNIPAPPKRRK